MICDIALKTTAETLCTAEAIYENFTDLQLVVNKVCCLETGENFSTLIPYKVCVGDTVTLRALGGDSWLWEGPDSFSSSNQEPTIADVQLAASGLYTVTIIDNTTDCEFTKYIYLEVEQCCPQNIPGVATSEASIGDTANFYLFIPDGYTLDTVAWSGPDSFVSAVQNPTLLIDGFEQQGIYIATITLNECEGEFNTYFYLEINPVYFPTVNPDVAPPPDPDNCDDESPYLNQFIIDTNGSTWFIDYNGCAILLRESCSEDAVYISGTALACLDDNILLFANGGASYSWTGPQAFTSALQNPTVLADNVNKSGNYICEITLANGCTVIRAIYVQVIYCPAPVAGISISCEEGPVSS